MGVGLVHRLVYRAGLQQFERWKPPRDHKRHPLADECVVVNEQCFHPRGPATGNAAVPMAAQASFCMSAWPMHSGPPITRCEAPAQCVCCRIDHHLATPATAALARRESIYLGPRFSDHAPSIIDHDLGPWSSWA